MGARRGSECTKLSRAFKVMFFQTARFFTCLPVNRCGLIAAMDLEDEADNGPTTAFAHRSMKCENRSRIDVDRGESGGSARRRRSIQVNSQVHDCQRGTPTV